MADRVDRTAVAAGVDRPGRELIGNAMEAAKKPPLAALHDDPRPDYLPWMWQVKCSTAKNVTHVSDKMLHACGGTGYKPALGIERYLRDGKAGWVMGPTNEVLRQFVGKYALLGFDSLDYWNQSVNERVLANEIKKLDKDAKKQLAEKLLAEV